MTSVTPPPAMPPNTAWDQFVHMIRTQRRYVLPASQAAIDPRTWVANFTSQISRTGPAGTRVWRACILGPWEPVPPGVARMGAPPPHLARPMRVNAVGIPVFYCADDEYTAIAEVRPWRGADVWIAEWQFAHNLSVADLTAHVGQTTSAWAQYFARVAQSMALPVHPDGSDVDYVATQYVADVLREAGFQAVYFHSCQSASGRNIAVFDPAQLQICGQPYVRTVQDVGYQAQ